MKTASKKGEALATALKAVAATGTPEALSANHEFVDWVIIQALQGNTSTLLCVGDSNVDLTTARGTVLGKLNSVSLHGVYLDEVFVDVGTNGDGVSMIYKETRKL